MRNITLLFAILTMIVINTSYGQEYYPLPEENAYWSVMECDPGCYAIIYHVDGDTLLNGNMYKKIYKYMVGQSFYDTVATLHCFMRQNIEEKRIWFIRHYLGESTEKLGYDLSVNVGESVSLPAFDHGGYNSDSIFMLYSIDSIDLSIIGELAGYRKRYLFSSNQSYLEYTEGIYEGSSTFPNFSNMGPLILSTTECVEVNGEWWRVSFGVNPPYNLHCGFNLLNVDEFERKELLSIYPNPTSEFIMLEIPKSFSDGSVQIFNILGKKVYEQAIQATDKLMRIDTKSFKDGIFLLKLNSGVLSFSTKFIIKH